MQFRLTFHLVNNVSLAIWSCLRLQKSAWQLHLLRCICPSQGWGCGCAFALPIKRFCWSARMWLLALITNLALILNGYLPPLPWPGSSSPATPETLTSVHHFLCLWSSLPSFPWELDHGGAGRTLSLVYEDQSMADLIRPPHICYTTIPKSQQMKNPFANFSQ